MAHLKINLRTLSDQVGIYSLAGIYIFVHVLLKKNALFDQKKIKLQNKQHFVENKTQITQHVLIMQ